MRVGDPSATPEHVAERSCAGAPQLFVVHAPEDSAFVYGFLLDALNLPADEVLVSSQLEPGAVIVDEIARGATSPLTVAVVSPAFKDSPWAQFASQLATHHSVETAEVGTSLVPAILADCDLPLLSRSLVALDFREPAQWEAEAARLRKKLRARPHVVARLSCPYPGSRPFTAAEAALFHGRHREIGELTRLLRDGARAVCVVGPSGSGKSSLVMAGMVPALRESPDLAVGSAVIVVLRAGASPIATLREALATTPPYHSASLRDAVDRLLAAEVSDRLLVFIDQLEELCNLAESEPRASFVAALGALCRDPRVVVVLGLRADSYASPVMSALRAELGVALRRIEVSPLHRDELRLAIEAPARERGVYFEPVLVERLLHDCGNQPGALALVQDTLHELWRHRKRRLLRVSEYAALGEGECAGLAAIAIWRAESMLRELTPRNQAIVRRVVLRLLQFGDGVVTPSPQSRASLTTASDAPEDIDAVIRHMADRRLVTTSGGRGGTGSARVELAHEALLSWPMLREWVAVWRDDELRRRALEARALEWHQHGRGDARLLEGDELTEVRSWLSAERARELGVTETLQALLDRSHTVRAAHVSERERRIGDQRRQILRDYVFRGHAELISGRPAQAIPFLVAALTAGDSADNEALRMLFRWASQGVPLLHMPHHKEVLAIAWSPDGSRLATASSDCSSRVWDAASGKAMAGPLLHGGSINAVAWSPDGKRIATASEDRCARVWDALTGEPITPLLVHGDAVRAAAWSPNGIFLATASEDGTARVWHAVSGQAVGDPFVHLDGVRAVAWSPGGVRIATASYDGTAGVWDVARQTRVLTLSHRDSVLSVAWSQGGGQLATASADKTARIWDASSGASLAVPLTHGGGVTTVAWSPDSKRIVTASSDCSARVWDAPTGRPVTPPLTHRGGIKAAAWSPDGRRIVTASADHSARIWDAVTGQPVTPPLRHHGWVKATVWSPDGTRVASASYDDIARIWNASHGFSVIPPLAHRGWVKMVEWSPDGTRVATASYDSTARVWSAFDGQAVTPVLAHRRIGKVRAVAWSPSGRYLATASEDRTAQIWDPIRGCAITPPLAHLDWVNAVAWRPDGTQVATASDDRTVRIWDIRTGREVVPPLRHAKKIKAVAWSLDGMCLATAGEDVTAQLWSALSGQPVSLSLAHRNEVTAIAWSPDGTRVTTASKDHVARIWDAVTGKPLTPPLEHQHGVLHVAWSPDGTRVATASEDHTARVWDALTAKALTPPLAHQSIVYTVAWSPDGTRVATASDDRTARVWDGITGCSLTPPLVHRLAVRAVSWSPDGTRLATASDDETARIWEVSGEASDIGDWLAALKRCGYSLSESGNLTGPKHRPSRTISPTNHATGLGSSSGPSSH
jgi:WD40 repeat protein